MTELQRAERLAHREAIRNVHKKAVDEGLLFAREQERWFKKQTVTE